MKKKKPTRVEIVSKALRTLALEVDPRGGSLRALAEEISVHPVTVSDWIAAGHVPDFQVAKLVKRFGEEMVDKRLTDRSR